MNTEEVDRFWINSYSSYTKKRWISSVTQNTKWTLKHYAGNGLNASVCIIRHLIFTLCKLTNTRNLIRYPKGTTLGLRLCTYSTTIPDLWAGSEKVQGGHQSPDSHMFRSKKMIDSFRRKANYSNSNQVVVLSWATELFIFGVHIGMR